MPRLEQARMLAALEDGLGLPVDLLVKCVHDPASPFEIMTQAQAEALNQSHP